MRAQPFSGAGVPCCCTNPLFEPGYQPAQPPRYLLGIIAHRTPICLTRRVPSCLPHSLFTSLLQFQSLSRKAVSGRQSTSSSSWVASSRTCTNTRRQTTMTLTPTTHHLNLSIPRPLPVPAGNPSRQSQSMRDHWFPSTVIQSRFLSFLHHLQCRRTVIKKMLYLVGILHSGAEGCSPCLRGELSHGHVTYGW